MSQPTIPKPARCPVQPENIPAEMKARAQWVNWRWTWRGAQKQGKAKWDKPLFDARTGKLASSTDPATWASFDVAYNAYRDPRNGFDGIGYVFSGDADDFVGIDLDHCCDPETGAIQTWSPAQRQCKHWTPTVPNPIQIIEALGTYAEVSPSGTGVKLIVRGGIPRGIKHGSVEMYRVGRYFTVTGNRLPGAPAQINESAALDEVFRQIRRAAKGSQTETPSRSNDRRRPATSADYELLADGGPGLGRLPQRCQ